MFSDYVLLLFTTEPRRAKALFNVCRGRRTVSTLFAGLAAQQLDWLDSWHGVALPKFEAAAKQLVQAGDLAVPTPGCLQLTQAGVTHQAQLRQQRYQPIAWQQFQQVDVRRFNVLSQLALQVVSELSHQANRYYPVTTDQGVQATVKLWLRHWYTPQLVDQVVTELTAFLTTLPKPLADVFANSLTGFDFPGQTDQQLATLFDRSPVEILVMRKDLSCRWVAWLRTHSTGPLAALLQPLVKANPVSQSAWQTYQDFLAGTELSQIATRRQLKMSTVREHLLEVAILTPSFSFDRLLSPAKQQQLAQTYVDMSSVAQWRFDQVQAVVPDFDFFDFRLYQIMRCHHATD